MCLSPTLGLDFATNQELVNELINRTTFAGIVVCSRKERKSDEVHDNWNVYSSLNVEQTKLILENALEQTTSNE